MSSAAHAELRARVERALADLPEPLPYDRVLEHRMRWFAVFQVSEVLLLVLAPWWPLKLCVAAVFGVYRARTIWTVVHERVHRRELPTTPAKLFYDLCTVFVAHWWRMHHLRHHARTNTPQDPDTRLFLGRDLNDVRRPLRAGRGLRFVGTLAQFPFLFVLFLTRSLSGYAWRDAAAQLAFVAVYPALLALLLPPPEAMVHSLANMFLGAAYVVFTFAPTHSAHPYNFDVAEDPLLEPFVTTNDVWPTSRVWSHLCGGINCHVAHHLFPRVPYPCLPIVSAVVRAFAQERGLSYHTHSPIGIWRAHLAFLWGS